MYNFSVQEAVDKIRKEFRDLTNDEFKLGVARAINHTLAKTKTASSREMRMVYAISAKDVNKALSIRRANSGQLYGFIIAQGRPIPLKNFKPRQTNAGVSVMIKKGMRTTVKGAFMPTMPSGHTGVFARGKYTKSDFSFRHQRTRAAGGYKLVNGRWRPIINDLEISEVSTLTTPKMFSNTVVMNNIFKQIEQDFPTRMMHELLRIRT